MPSQWNLIHPRFAFWLRLGRPGRALGIVLTLVAFLALFLLALFGAVFVVGRFGIGPLAPEAMREREFLSVVLGCAGAALFAWLTFRSLRRQWHDSTRAYEIIEGAVTALKEDFDITDGGRSEYLVATIHGAEYILPFRVKKYVRPGMGLRIRRWAESGQINAIWVAW